MTMAMFRDFLDIRRDSGELFAGLYDVPMAKAYGTPYYEKVRDMVRHMLSYVCKTNEDVRAVVLSGCLYTVKNSTYTGINNTVPYTALSPIFASVLDGSYSEAMGPRSYWLKDIGDRAGDEPTAGMREPGSAPLSEFSEHILHTDHHGWQIPGRSNAMAIRHPLCKRKLQETIIHTVREPQYTETARDRMVAGCFFLQ